jgi:hypothetical protein
MKTLRRRLLAFVLAFGLLANSAWAANLADVDRFLDWAEHTYPDLISPPGQTQAWGDLHFRFYSNDIAAGVNPVGDVLLLVNGQLSYVGSLQDLLPMAFGGPQPGTGPCVAVALPTVGSRQVQVISGTPGGTIVNGTIDRTYLAATPTHQRFEDIFSTSQDFGPQAGTTSISGTSVTDKTTETVDGLRRLLVREVDTTSRFNGAAPANHHTKSVFSPGQVESPAQPGQLCVGQTWNSPSVTELRYVDANPAKTEHTLAMSYRVEGFETIETKAGRFDTVKISAHDQLGGYHFVWFSPTLGIELQVQQYNLIGLPQLRYETTLLQQ